VIARFVGFQVMSLVREYRFSVREPSNEVREYTVTIANEAFVSHRARYQDGPDICLSRLNRELASNANHPDATEFAVTDLELADYHDRHRPKVTASYKVNREK